MAFTVAIGTGVAIIPCGNSTHRTPYTPTARTLHVARAKKLSSDSQPVTAAAEPQPSPEIEASVADSDFSFNYAELPGQEPDFWEGPQWDWFGTFVKYSWIIGFPVAASLALYGCFTFHEPPERVKLAAAKKYSVQNYSVQSAESVDSVESESVDPSEVFEEPDAYDSDVFDSNPTEVAPSLK
ncbi:uncharacterized protein LOC109788208 [Cajanus cajan]|uniref:Uncharacterized protein n=1 Tax=Cajanus cajan TaxID=3821 RepID=A0A151RCQ6_CAJCA|nr:uncharacterized protein LOC109788208 [Cajanus cajan]KYP40165.1 hypothetical protein KK1_038499 [Cajanus cajan]